MYNMTHVVDMMDVDMDGPDVRVLLGLSKSDLIAIILRERRQRTTHTTNRTSTSMSSDFTTETDGVSMQMVMDSMSSKEKNEEKEEKEEKEETEETEECVSNSPMEVDETLMKCSNAILKGKLDKIEEQPQQPQQPYVSRKHRRKERRNNVSFDWDAFSKRHIAIHVSYLGWNYHGLAMQDAAASSETIEDYLFKALIRLKLVKDRYSCKFQRCGRTDKGVSAYGQVLDLHVRSNLYGAAADGEIGMVEVADGGDNKGNSRAQEFNYVQMINRCLPPDIRIVAWAPVPETFDSRFGCLFRTYRYYFLRGDLDVSLLAIACKKFVGNHSFDNFCKIDQAKVELGQLNHRRTIHSFDLSLVEARPSGDALIMAANDGAVLSSHCDVFAFTIVGVAFLWHQVRCMVGVLFRIGLGVEEPEIIDHLLNLDAVPRKPQYDMADDKALVLHHCGFEGLRWRHGQAATIMELQRNLEEQYHLQSTRASVAGSFLNGCKKMQVNVPEALASAPESTRLAASEHELPEYMPWEKLRAFLRNLELKIVVKGDGSRENLRRGRDAIAGGSVTQHRVSMKNGSATGHQFASGIGFGLQPDILKPPPLLQRKMGLSVVDRLGRLQTKQDNGIGSRMVAQNQKKRTNIEDPLTRPIKRNKDTGNDTPE